MSNITSVSYTGGAVKVILYSRKRSDKIAENSKYGIVSRDETFIL